MSRLWGEWEISEVYQGKWNRRMDFAHHTREQLIERIRELELHNVKLLEQHERDLADQNERLEHRASTDGLTGIANHRTLMERLTSLLADADEKPVPVSVSMFDIDNFKVVNDTHGHLAGDQVLTTIAGLLTEGVRSRDLAGRYGGEEFLVIFPDTEVSQAASISERIRAAIEAHTFNDGIRLTISAGVASATGGSHTNLVSLADTRLYAAKRAGKNQVVSD